MTDFSLVSLPKSLLPADGRFGCGPSLVRPEQINKIGQSKLMGTSHRQAPVKELVKSLRTGLKQLFNAPDSYEVILGNGGASAFWAAATASLVRNQASHGVFGEFGAKFASQTQAAPFLEPSIINSAEPGQLALPNLSTQADVLAWPHQETSTGVVAPINRLGRSGQLNLIDATSIAGAVEVNLSEVDVYYFSGQKAFGTDGGLWIALFSPAALARARELHDAFNKQKISNSYQRNLDTKMPRWIPDFLDLQQAINNSRKDQTLNTPAIATLIMWKEQVSWLQEKGGLQWAQKHCEKNSKLIYDWATSRDWAHPFVNDPTLRSPVVATIDVDKRISVPDLLAALRRFGIVDMNSYRSLGRNQLRIGAFPATSTESVQALLECIDYLVDRY